MSDSKQANPADVATIDDIIRVLYEVISFPPGGSPDWDRLRSLFIPGARLIPPRAEDQSELQVMSVEEFIAWGSSFFEENNLSATGFFENDVARRIDRFGNIAHVLSIYESRHAAGDQDPFERGINSIQLWNDGARWWTVTILWDTERSENPIPAEYLKEAVR